MKETRVWNRLDENHGAKLSYRYAWLTSIDDRDQRLSDLQG